MIINAYVLSCPERESVRAQTLQNLHATDWPGSPRVVIDPVKYPRHQERQEKNALRLLQQAVEEASDVILFLEDDLQFNHHLRCNLENWAPLRQCAEGDFFFGSLYNPGVSELKRYAHLNFFVANPISVYGSQAFILSRATAEYAITHWDEVEGMQDIKISRLAAQRSSLFYHQPSLVQHLGASSVWGGSFHTARDFQPGWQNRGVNPSPEAAVECINILDKMRLCDGWLDEDEAELLLSTAKRVADRSPHGSPAAVIEVSSLCGKSTVVLALALKGLQPHDLRLTSISPHDGQVTGLDGSLQQYGPTYEKFTCSMRMAGAQDWIDLLVARAADVPWNRPVALLLIDGLHDEASIAADFNPFAPWLIPGSLVAFHDYGSHFPAVRRFVDGLLSRDGFRIHGQAKSLVVLEKRN